MTSRRNTRRSNRNSLFGALKQVMRDSLRGFAPTTPRSRICKLKPRFETLEDRRLLALVWANRGDASDMFDAAFGASAEVARNVVDSALAEWNRVVTGYQGQDFETQMTIAMDPTDPATSALASNTISDANGVPISGDVTIKMALDEGGNTQWYLDPTPDDHSEFMGSLVHAFARNPTPGGPADGMRDLRTLLIHELGHTMGVSSGSPLMYSNPAITMTNTGITDNSVGDGDNSYWLFQGPSVNAVMTDFDIGAEVTNSAGHAAMPLSGNPPINFGGQLYYTSVDTMQPTSLSIRRILLTNKVGLMMQDMGYDVVMPETFGTFHSVLDSATGLLTIQGGNDNTLINNLDQGASADTINLIRIGNLVIVSIDVGVDVPGTGPGMTPQDQQDAFFSVFSIGDINDVRIEGFAGNDAINLVGDFDFLRTLQVFGGDGDDGISGAALAGSQGLRAFGDDGSDTLVGGAGADLLVGGGDADSLSGGDGADTLSGDGWARGAPLDLGMVGGDDTIQGGPGNDTIYGQGGNDFIGGWLGDDLILCGDGNDIASGDDGDDIVVGEAGNDLVAGGAGNDTVTGGIGNDILVGGLFSAGASVVAETGDDSLDGGDGTDTLFGDSWALGAPLDFGFLGGDDIIQGGPGNDNIYGQAGNDFIGGWLGNDMIFGGRGDDIASGDQGNDVVHGESGNDLVAGGDGNDTVTGGSGNDILVGGWFSAGASVVADTGDDLLEGGSGADTLFGDSWAFGAPLDFGVQGGHDTLRGGSGNDLAVGQSGDDSLDGGAGNDTLLGADGNDLIRGGSGDDQLGGGGGHDLLLGESGVDALTGGDGRDVLIGGLDADTLDGGADDDILIAGTTSHDADDVALNQILDEWTSEARNYQKRVNNLKGNGNGPDFANRLNGNVFLKKNGPNAKAFDDNDSDTLTGSTGDDWFLFDPQLDELLDWVGGETKN